MSLPFLKMNGAGNDFIIFDGRKDIIRLTREQVQHIAARDNSNTKGCDQVIVMESSKKADVFMRIYNHDGGEVDACGNATRCVASILEEELQRLPVTIETNAGLLQGLQKAYSPEEEEYILVDLGAAKFGWKEIPLALPPEDAARKLEKFASPTWGKPAFVSMGNPHVVYFLGFDPKNSAASDLTDLHALDLKTIGPKMEKFTEVFPEGVNVSVALLRAAADGDHIIHARVWERGAGLTKACGTAACAMLAAAHARDASVRAAHLWFEPEAHAVTVKMDDNNHILLGGPIETEFQGKLAL